MFNDLDPGQYDLEVVGNASDNDGDVIKRSFWISKNA